MQHIKVLLNKGTISKNNKILYVTRTILFQECTNSSNGWVIIFLHILSTVTFFYTYFFYHVIYFSLHFSLNLYKKNYTNRIFQHITVTREIAFFLWNFMQRNRDSHPNWNLVKMLFVWKGLWVTALMLISGHCDLQNRENLIDKLWFSLSHKAWRHWSSLCNLCLFQFVFLFHLECGAWFHVTRALAGWWWTRAI